MKLPPLLFQFNKTLRMESLLFFMTLGVRTSHRFLPKAHCSPCAGGCDRARGCTATVRGSSCAVGCWG